MAINIEKMRHLLLEKHKELTGEIAGLTEAYPKPIGPEEASEGSQEFEDAAVDFLEMQQEQSIMYTEQALLQEIAAALKHIDEGTYGICIDCGRPIPEKRLEAIPWAARCIQDEERVEAFNLGREELYHTEEDNLSFQ